jgi:hypothetical protein
MITKLVANHYVYCQYGGIIIYDFPIDLVIKYICVIQNLYIRITFKIDMAKTRRRSSRRRSGSNKDSCYYSVKARYDVFPSAYASGAIAKCRKNKGKK